MANLTETEAMGKCIAAALHDEPNSFGAEQAKKATGMATTLFQKGHLDSDTFGRVIGRLGNHSALRQWAVAQGFLGKAEDALAIAVKKELKVIDEALEKAAK